MVAMPECMNAFGAEAFHLVGRRHCMLLGLANGRFEFVHNPTHDGTTLSVGWIVVCGVGIDRDEDQL